MLAALALLLAGTGALAFGGAAAARTVRLPDLPGASRPPSGGALLGIRPELFAVVLVAALANQPSIAAGAALGWSVFLASVGFGVGVLVARRPAPAPAPGTLVTLLPGGALVVGAFALSDQVLTRLEGAVLLSGFVLFLGIVMQEGTLAVARGGRAASDVPTAAPRRAGVTAVIAVVGLALLAIGAAFLVAGTRGLAMHTRLSPGFVGAAIAGALAAGDAVLFQVSMVASGRGDLAAGDLLVGIAASTIGALGVAALARPLVVDSAAASAYPAAAVAFTVVATAFLATGRAGRVVGVCLLGVYAGWLAFAARL